MILADTGFFLAVASATDRDHAAAVKALGKVREPLVTTWPVVTEVCHLMAARLGHLALERFIDRASHGAFDLFPLTSQHLPRLHELVDKYRDLPMDLADASLVVLAEELGTGRILSTDRRDFGTYRWKNRRPFHNLLSL